jgi:hypothetical protein
MALSPFGGCNPTPPPGDCGLLFDVGEAILGSAVLGLEPYLPTEGCNETFDTYVSMGQPVAEFCDALSVNLVSFGPSGTLRLSECSTGVWPDLVAEWRVELWENCYPTLDDAGNPPTFDALHQVNEHIYAHGLALYNASLAGWLNKTATYPPKVQNVTFGPLTPAGPQGGAVGWKFAVSTVIA